MKNFTNSIKSHSESSTTNDLPPKHEIRSRHANLHPIRQKPQILFTKYQKPQTRNATGPKARR